MPKGIKATKTQRGFLMNAELIVDGLMLVFGLAGMAFLFQNRP